ncbi:hypothetical protein NEIG_01122 [Nematocida sp. ERTm5]|nr:hypothetical protein NEIG_01122 [Nematocida sp. ERTm5]
METNERILDIIENKETKYDYGAIKNIEKLSYCYHYHVQVVDNSAHQVHIIHHPFFVSNDTGTIKYNYIYTLEDIVAYIKRVFHINDNKSNPFINNVYPFKYNRAEKTWSLVTKPNNAEAKRRKLKVTENEMNKTMEEMHNSGFDVVFYYIKENIKTTEFVFAQFNPIDEMVINKVHEEDEEEAKKLFDGYMINRTAPRIPLFLPKLMTSAIHLGPYVLKSERIYQFKYLDEFQNLTPIEFSNWLDHVANKILPNQKKLIEVVKDYKQCINYYSDFVILGLNQPYEDCDCYSMYVTMKILPENTIQLVWNTKKQHNLGEYANYRLDLVPLHKNGTINEEESRNNIKLAISFLNTFQRKHVSQDMLYYGICVCTLKETNNSIVSIIACPEMKSQLHELFNKNNKMYCMLSPEIRENCQKLKDCLNIQISDLYNFSKIHITIKSVNYTKSKLGLHYNILNIFF